MTRTTPDERAVALPTSMDGRVIRVLPAKTVGAKRLHPSSESMILARIFPSCCLRIAARCWRSPHACHFLRLSCLSVVPWSFSLCWSVPGGTNGVMASSEATPFWPVAAIGFVANFLDTLGWGALR